MIAWVYRFESPFRGGRLEHGLLSSLFIYILQSLWKMLSTGIESPALIPGIYIGLVPFYGRTSGGACVMIPVRLI